MTFRQAVLIGALIVIGVSQSGCASMGKKIKAFLNGKSTSSATAATPTTSAPKFSQAGDLPPRVKRQYRRTTKETLSEEAALDQKSGSLWVMEGQGAYLFSQNIVRMVGDPIGVMIEGEPREQLQSKVDVIRTLLSKFEERQRLRQRNPAGEMDQKGADEKVAEKDDKQKADKAAAEKMASNKPAEPADLNIKTVPTRIVERTLDGNYRVKGTQPFMIGSREYRVIVTGIVRAEDFDEEGISAAKLLDPKFDIVSARRKEEM